MFTGRTFRFDSMPDTHDRGYQFSVGDIFMLTAIVSASLTLLTGVVGNDAGLMLLGGIADVGLAMYLTYRV